MLAEWRAAERDLEAATDDAERACLETRVHALQAEYRRLTNSG